MTYIHWNRVVHVLESINCSIKFSYTEVAMTQNKDVIVENEVYGDDSIWALKGAERVRDKPAAMLGTSDINGAFHTIIEIIGNSMDEVRAGYGKKLIVIYHEDGSISIRDFGRGVPLGWNEKEQQFNWFLIFNELYAGGKYGKSNMYKYSIGTNGLGAACTQYTSEWFKVTSYRDGKATTKEFKDGFPIDDLPAVSVDDAESPTGTLIHWKPDARVFTSVDFPDLMLSKLFEIQAHLNEIDIEYTNLKHGKGTVVFEGKGLKGYFESSLPAESIKGVFGAEATSTGTEGGKDYSAKVELYVAFTEENTNRPMYFHNTAKMGQGNHVSARYSALTDFFKMIGKENGVTIIPSDYEEHINIAVSSYSNSDATSFIGQTKDGVTSIFILNLIYNTLLDLLEDLYAKRNPVMMETVEKVVFLAQVRKEAKEFEAKRKLVNNVSKKKRTQTAEKFIGNTDRNNPNAELFIVEGDSALGACRDARDPKTQALLPLKGKPINALKAQLDKLLKNLVVRDIINSLSCGVETSDGVGNFDEDSLPYSKIIFATDADVDGQQIRVLLYTIFYVLYPTLLKKGYIYVVESPLYELECKQGNDFKSYFAYSIAERDRMMDKLAREGIRVLKVNRSKGLGSNTPEMMAETTMNPETRKLVPLTIDINDEVVRLVSDMLFGNDESKSRKGYIMDIIKNSMSLNMDLADLADTIDALTEADQEESGEEIA